jgi:hypothetical protein
MEPFGQIDFLHNTPHDLNDDAYETLARTIAQTNEEAIAYLLFHEERTNPLRRRFRWLLNLAISLYVLCFALLGWSHFSGPHADPLTWQVYAAGISLIAATAIMFGCREILFKYVLGAMADFRARRNAP